MTHRLSLTSICPIPASVTLRSNKKIGTIRDANIEYKKKKIWQLAPYFFTAISLFTLKEKGLIMVNFRDHTLESKR